MNFIDKYAYCSKLRKIKPVKKIIFSLIILVICLLMDNVIFSAGILVFMSWVTVFIGKTPIKAYLRLMLLPVSFLLLGIITIAIEFEGLKESYYYATSVYGLLFGVSKDGAREAVNLFFKSFASVACLYYLSFSTPMVDLLMGLRQLKIPAILVEIMGLIYRFIFILLEMSEKIFTAQNSRLGYISIRTSFKSMALLSSVLLIRALKKSDNIYTAMEARGYEGEIKVLSEK